MASSLYFDYIICPPQSAEDILRSRIWFPRRKSLTLTFRPYWRGRRMFFWHAFRKKKGDYDLDGAYVDERKKYLYLGAKTEALRTKKIVIVFSNTQNNLSLISSQTGQEFCEKISASQISRLKSEADLFFGQKTEMLVVTRPELFVRDKFRCGFNVRFVKPDETEWQGHSPSWAHAIERFLWSRKPLWSRTVERLHEVVARVRGRPPIRCAERHGSV